MKIGDMVMYAYGSNHPYVGIVVEKDQKPGGNWFFVHWSGKENEWEEEIELEVFEL